VSDLAPLAFTSMSDGERRFLLRNILLDTSLWAFSVVAAQLGVDGAVGVCRSRELPPEVVEVLAPGHGGVKNLPSYADAVALTWAPRVYMTLHPRPKKEKGASKKPEVPPLRVVAANLGLTMDQLHAVRRVLDEYALPELPG
jgi:hypothetical protein